MRRDRAVRGRAAGGSCRRGPACAASSRSTPGLRHFAALLLAAERISATVTRYAERHLRFGCGLAVDEADVDAAVAGVARIARRG